MKVTFYSPGSFVSETTVIDTDLTDPNQIKLLARALHCIPFAFRIEDHKPIYHLGGTILTLEDIPDTPENEILRWNMKNNNIERVIENTNSWKHTSILHPEDVVLEWEPRPWN